MISPSKLRSDIYRILDEILRTGTPIEVTRRGRRLRIVPVEPSSRLDALTPHPDAAVGDPADLAEVGWAGEWRP